MDWDLVFLYSFWKPSWQQLLKEFLKTRSWGVIEEVQGFLLQQNLNWTFVFIHHPEEHNGKWGVMVKKYIIYCVAAQQVKKTHLKITPKLTCTENLFSSIWSADLLNTHFLTYFWIPLVQRRSNQRNEHQYWDLDDL